MKEQRIDYALEIPKLLSFLAFNDPEAEVKGLDQVPRRDWPNVSFVFQMYHLMIATWIFMLLLTIRTFYLWKKGTLASSHKTLYMLVFSVIVPQIGNQAGWIAAEMGRYPWIVQGLLRISEGLSKSVAASHVFASLILFMIVYTLLFMVFLYLIHDKIQKGPDWEDQELTPYMHMKEVLEERS
jgi:cytochrome d ubiquinol oxidase subunit I